MKISTFNPQIITSDAESLVKVFEALGFDKRHQQEGIGDLDVTGIRMKDSDGHYVDISEVDIGLKEDKVAIRMNVDDFDEAYEKLEALGFKNIYGYHQVDTKTAKSAMMISPGGFGINLIEHKK
ncbi:MAG: hypothetical protein J6H21_01805 [Firmicutes bacterium]|nr:hypothetical protein [Bacillota bacterium]